MGDKKAVIPPGRQLGIKTLEFTLNIGVVRGYGHDNAGGPVSPASQVAADWQEIGELMRREYGVYPAGVVSPGVTLYEADRGCPRGGEITVTISGLANPRYVTSVDGAPDLQHWRFVVEVAAEALRKKLDQTTAYLTFRKVRFVYLAPQIPF